MNSKKIINKYFILFFFGYFISCNTFNDNLKIEPSQVVDFETIFECDTFILKKDNNSFNLFIKDSKLPNGLSREFASSCASLKLYEIINESYPQVDSDTKISIKYSDTNSLYSYKLQDLSDVLYGLDKLTNVIDRFKTNKINENDFMSSVLNKALIDPNIDLKKITDFSLLGFKIKENQFNKQTINYLIYTMPLEKQIWININRHTHKIVSIYQDGENIP